MLVEGAQAVARDLRRSRPSTPYRGDEIFPGAATHSDADLVAFIRRKAETVYHPVGTCRMGSDDAAVVDRNCACAASTACASSMRR